MINSSSITYDTENNQNPASLIPLMFIQELPSSGVLDIQAPDSKDLYLKAIYRQRMRNDLRTSLCKEYLSRLRQYAIMKKIRDIYKWDILFGFSFSNHQNES